MSRFRSVFASRHVVLPIIHVSGEEQALRNAALARAGGADGAFLISHGAVCGETLLAVYEEARRAQPGWWVGVNCLSWPAEALFSRLPAGAQGAWVDDAQIDESSEEQPAASRVLEAQRRSGWRGLYFGGVAFKYQRPVRDLAA